MTRAVDVDQLALGIEVAVAISDGDKQFGDRHCCPALVPDGKMAGNKIFEIAIKYLSALRFHANQ